MKSLSVLTLSGLAAAAVIPPLTPTDTVEIDPAPFALTSADDVCAQVKGKPYCCSTSAKDDGSVTCEPVEAGLSTAEFVQDCATDQMTAYCCLPKPDETSKLLCFPPEAVPTNVNTLSLVPPIDGTSPSPALAGAPAIVAEALQVAQAIARALEDTLRITLSAAQVEQLAGVIAAGERPSALETMVAELLAKAASSHEDIRALGKAVAEGQAGAEEMREELDRVLGVIQGFYDAQEALAAVEEAKKVDEVVPGAEAANVAADAAQADPVNVVEETTPLQD